MTGQDLSSPTFASFCTWVQHPPGARREAPRLPQFPLPPIEFPYHRFGGFCIRTSPRGYVPVRERLAIERLFCLCARLRRGLPVLRRFDREHDIFFYATDQLELIERHVSRALAGPPGHSALERFYIVTDPGAVSSGTRFVEVFASEAEGAEEPPIVEVEDK